MDPDANLTEQLSIANTMLDSFDQNYDGIDENGHFETEDVLRLAELVITLNDWIITGGFLPKAWHHSNHGQTTISDRAALKLTADIEKLRNNLPKRK